MRNSPVCSRGEEDVTPLPACNQGNQNLYKVRGQADGLLPCSSFRGSNVEAVAAVALPRFADPHSPRLEHKVRVRNGHSYRLTETRSCHDENCVTPLQRSGIWDELWPNFEYVNKRASTSTVATEGNWTPRQGLSDSYFRFTAVSIDEKIREWLFLMVLADLSFDCISRIQCVISRK